MEKETGRVAENNEVGVERSAEGMGKDTVVGNRNGKVVIILAATFQIKMNASDALAFASAITRNAEYILSGGDKKDGG